MWISRKELEELSERIKKLEDVTTIASHEGKLYHTRFDYPVAPIAEIVCKIASHLGLKYERPPAKWTFSDPSDRSNA